MDDINSNVLPDLRSFWIEVEGFHSSKAPPPPLLSLFRKRSQPHPSLAAWLAWKEAGFWKTLPLTLAMTFLCSLPCLPNFSATLLTHPAAALCMASGTALTEGMRGEERIDSHREKLGSSELCLLWLRLPTAAAKQNLGAFILYTRIEEVDLLYTAEQGGWFS